MQSPDHAVEPKLARPTTSQRARTSGDLRAASPPNPQEETPDAVPERLEILDELVESYFGGMRPFEGVTALFIQHQLGSIVPMTKAFIALGLDPRRLHWMDIPYTSNPIVRSALRRLGVPAKNFLPGKFKITTRYVPYMRARAQRAIIDFSHSLTRDDTLLVMDDGSYFVEGLSCFRTRPHPVKIVEQTQRGIIKLNRDAAMRHAASLLPIVNVAESHPKKDWESPFIGDAVCRSLIQRLNRRLQLAPADKCLLLGFGAIGRAVADSLRTRFDLPPERLYVTDVNPQALSDARAQGHPIWERSLDPLVRFKLVIGCSGTTSFHLGDRVFLEDGACLASASSGASELSREEFIELADTVGEDDIYVKGREDLESRNIHSDIDIHVVDRVVSFLNGGFPVNFDGHVNCVPWRHIQVTKAIQVGGAVQALNDTQRGLIDLDPRLCEWTVERMRFYHERDNLPIPSSLTPASTR